MKFNFTDTRSFLKTIVLIIIIIAIAIPAAYLFFPVRTNSKAYPFVPLQATSPQNPDPTPEPEVNDNDQLIFSSRGGSPGGKGSSSGSSSSGDENENPDNGGPKKYDGPLEQREAVAFFPDSRPTPTLIFRH